MASYGAHGQYVDACACDNLRLTSTRALGVLCILCLVLRLAGGRSRIRVECILQLETRGDCVMASRMRHGPRLGDLLPVRSHPRATRNGGSVKLPDLPASPKKVDEHCPPIKTTPRIKPVGSQEESLESPEWLYMSSCGGSKKNSVVSRFSFPSKKSVDLRHMKQLPPELRHVDARHLEELTRYIERELKARGCEDAGLPSLARMAVFEEAMDRLLARCYAYRPFLEIYRREQARLRKVYVDRAAEIPALRVRAEALQAKADTKLEFELQAAVATVSELEKKIAELEGAVLASAEQVTTIQTQKLEAEEACKKEVDEVRDLRRSQAMLTSGLSRLEEERDRAVQLEATYKAEVLSLRVALDKEKCESERLRGHINELEILRLEERRKLVSEMEERLNLVTQELEDEREAHRTLLHRTVGTPTAPTPPPHGASGSSRCVSSASAATTSDEDRRSTQISPSRIDDTKLDGSNYNPPGAFFEAHGLDETVPMYLRFDGRVKNWAISKRETEKMINDIWSAKEAAEKEPSTPRVPLSSYLYTYLVGRFQSHVLAVEWAYNLLDGLNRYIADSDCSLFLKILAGDIPEEIRMDQLTMLVEVLQAMEREDKALNQGQASGTLTVAAAMGALKRLLRAKSEKNIVRLRRQLVLEVQDDPRNLVDYRSLLQSDEDGNQSDFCELLREQHVEEILEFSDHIASRVREVHAIYIMNNPDVEDKAKMPLGMFRNAITMADPNKSHDDVKVYLACGACCGPENVAELEQQKFGCVVETFLKGLCKCLLKPSPPTSCTVGAPS